MTVYSFSPFGYEGSLITVEVDLRMGIPAVDIVGLADGCVRESRERIKAAIKNSGIEFPQERVLISLSPADLKKEGAGFDLPIALGIYNAMRGNPSSGEGVLVMGELELSGALRPVRGVYAACLNAVEAGVTECVVPAVQAWEAEKAGMKTVHGVKDLKEAFDLTLNA